MTKKPKTKKPKTTRYRLKAWGSSVNPKAWQRPLSETLTVSRAATLDESLLASGFPYAIRETRETNLPEYAAFSLRARGVRRLGSAALDLAYVAAGRLDGYWELRLGSWDAAAGALLVEEAGGRISDLEGGPLDLDAPSIVASNGRIHDAMLGVLAQTRRGTG